MTAMLKSLLGALVALWFTQAGAATLEVWCWDKNFNIPAVQLAAERYAVTHPGFNIHITEISTYEGARKLSELLKAGRYEELPDVLLIENYSIKQYLYKHPEFLKSLEGRLDTDNFIPAALELSTDYKGLHYGVPFDSGVSALLVRDDLFSQAGFSSAALRNLTWAQFIQMGERIKQLTGIPLIPYEPDNNMELNLMLQSGRSWYTRSDGFTPDFKDNQVMRAAFETFKQLHDKGLLFRAKDWDEYLESFLTGKTAAVVTSCWMVPTLLKNASMRGKWRLYRLPSLAGVRGAHISNQGGSQWFVNAHSPQAELGANFLCTTFGEDRDLIGELAAKIQLISVMTRSEELPAYQKAFPFFGGQLVLRMLAQWNKEIPEVNYGMRSKELQRLAEYALQRYFGGVALDSALSEAQRHAEALN
ncbi:MAG: carbohydrate ABC transporter substrate-binding protein [Succinivibrio sp.]|nr:carbohydrate ABC transporter substrate-binding protein [Succinivibrio sp.]